MAEPLMRFDSAGAAVAEETSDEYLTIEQVAERLGLPEEVTRHFASRMAGRKKPEAKEVNGELVVSESAVARVQSGQLDLPWWYRVRLWVTANRLQRRLARTIILIGALGSAAAGVLALIVFFNGDGGGMADAIDVNAQPALEPTEEVQAESAANGTESDGVDPTGAVDESELLVDYLWPVPSTACEGYPMAMVDETTLDEYRQELSLAEDPRLTALRMGGVPYGHEQLSMTIRNPSETPAYIRRIAFPLASAPDKATVDPSWIMYTIKGCGDAFAGIPVDYLQYDLDDGRLVAVLADGSIAEVGSAPGLDFFGTEITSDEPFSLSVEVAACVGLHSWTVEIEYEMGGETKTLSVPDDDEPFQLLGSTHEGPVHIVAGSREPPGRSIEPAGDAAQDIVRSGGKVCG